ncbi:MAG: hypothetical protein F4011_05865 [Acidimicrobiaceae bacterium]|nr:hypothetical protein [Acidimicrobiaceae bacterium]MYH00877.1 hypothetical protein [Acidimicrobiaceae bacterium]MYL03695.1 hypothetical protein [Acidimicrobiaceae bacterium]
MSATVTSRDGLQTELDRRQSRLRPPEVVMQPAMMGAARLTRYSFSRTMLRRASRDGWRARRARFDVDGYGHGEAVYELRTGDCCFSFVAFTTTIDEAEHTDRVIAERWEIAAALVDGEATGDLLAMLRREVPLQEAGRLDPRVLVLTRGNRSVRFFDYLVGALARGEQPDPRLVADAGYILRSTAFYANGKYGMRSFEGYPDGHPLRVPYRAQFVCAWMFRELGYDLVERCARFRGGSASVTFDPCWRRYFGLGNATGLGLVPFAFKHPRVIHAWVAIRELALADVRSLTGTGERLARLEAWIERAYSHFLRGTEDDCRPFLNSVEVASVVARVRDAFERCRHESRPFDALYRWSEGHNPETTELVVSLLLELHEADDDLIDDLLTVDEHASLDPALTVGEMRALLDARFDWLAQLDLDDPSGDAWWWVISDNNEEPRRALRSRLNPANRDVAIDIALRLWRMRSALAAYPDSSPVHRVLREHPEHRIAAERLIVSDRAYGEPRDNACSVHYLPLLLQRFQLAMYGMDNFKPKSTDWLRVTLFQGAPRFSDLGNNEEDAWVLPPRPGTAS